MKSKLSIIVTDILLVVGLAMCLISDKDIHAESAWKSFHCILCAVWYILMFLHILQHWKLTKAFRMSKVRLKNRLTTLTIVVFIVMFFSIMTLIAIPTPGVNHFHNVFAHLFMVVIIAHLVAKSKRLITLMKSDK